MYYLYVLKCNDNSLYTGITNDIEKRMLAHKNGKGSKYVRAKLPFKLMYTEQFETKIEAMKREAFVKQLSRTEKLRIIGN